MNNGLVALGVLIWESTASPATKLQEKFKAGRITQHYDERYRILPDIVYPMASSH
jgi:hypothetical protein